MKTKICIKCGIEKPLSEFYKHKLTKDGYASDCKKCRKLYNKINKKHLKEKSDIWKEKNKNYLKEYNYNFKQKNRQKIKEQRQRNKDKINKRRRELYLINKEEIAKKRKKMQPLANKREKIRRKVDINFKITGNLRSRIRSAIRLHYGEKAYKTIELIGCTIDELRNHLEKQFTNGMSWGNYRKWEIDHIKPCASFDLIDLEQQKKCFHYTNLQPLWKLENIKKGAKIA